MNGLLAIERSEIEEQVNPVVKAAQDLIVVDAITYTMAMELGKACSARIKLVEEKLGPAKKKTYDAYQEVMSLMKSYIHPLETAKKLLSGRAYAWQKAEEYRKLREQKEACRLAEQEAAKKRAAEEDARLALAERMEKEGFREQAEEMLDAPVVVEIAEVAPPAPKVKVEGTSFQENWQFEIMDSSLVPRDYLIPDIVQIGRIVKVLKGETRIPGVRVFDVGSARFQKQK